MPQEASARSDPAGIESAHGQSTGAPLVTGARGFAGSHLVRRLVEDGCSPSTPTHSELDLLDPDAVRRAMAELAPSTIFHLAALSSVPFSWEHPHEAVLGNVRMTCNLLEAARVEAPGATVVLVGSGQVYGLPTELPLRESAPLEPGNPYAVSKALGEMLGRHYNEFFGIRVIRLRSFNHAGPGQSEEYVLSTLCRQVAEAEVRDADAAVLRTGDTSAARDFTDVRDVVRAYTLAADAEPGVYNVCSGHAIRIHELIDLLDERAQVTVRHEVDPGRLRPPEVSEVWGSYERLAEATGWRPEIPLEQTVSDTLDWWRRCLR